MWAFRLFTDGKENKGNARFEPNLKLNPRIAEICRFVTCRVHDDEKEHAVGIHGSEGAPVVGEERVCIVAAHAALFRPEDNRPAGKAGHQQPTQRCQGRAGRV